MINNIGFKVIARKIDKIPEFYTIFERKIPDYIRRQQDRGQAEANTEAEAEAKIFSPPSLLMFGFCVPVTKCLLVCLLLNA